MLKSIDEFVRLQEKASAGPWLVDAIKSYSQRENLFAPLADLEFIAHARNSDIGRIAQDLAARLVNVPKLWECPNCGFEMHEGHYREGDKEPCPCCAEMRLLERLAKIRAILTEEFRGSDFVIISANAKEILDLTDTAKPLGEK